MPPKKRPASASKAGAPPAKKAKSAVAIKIEPSLGSPSAVRAAKKTTGTEKKQDGLKERFIALFSLEEFKSGISNSQLKDKMGADSIAKLVPIINQLTSESRLVMSKTGKNELFYSLVSADVATKFKGLDTAARMVYQVIERAGNMGIWTKDIRLQTHQNIQTLNKIFKTLEARRLIKPVKSVTAKAKKLYMLYNLTPSKELTGGVWYSDLEFDHEFISELRTFAIHCVKRLNQAKGVTLTEIQGKMIQAKVSRIELSLEDVQQLVQTLVYDYLVEEAGENENGEVLYVSARRVTTMCDFKWWEHALSNDFHFRPIQFDDGLELVAHEPHYHTA
ncbi:III subunit RPC6 [Seminavis robusta]|uniref:III subunit RPC6 n=1 Tax=Seminavis robusta TaxID=568900 RepID=A0A9N8DNE5_9STRA|nr:III subunit RPC6 [Seminavis robusta]|eukprot:Sro244_g097180.1 III subunit RPC6 (334) ;mRNA; r:37857-38858